MSKMSRSVSRSLSRIMAIWRSVLSWMHWHRTRRAREQAYQDLLERMMVKLVETRKELRHLRLEQEASKQQILESQHNLLMSALRPMAAAMQRQDQLHKEYHQDQVHLLLEVLSSQQPSAQAQISQRLGPQIPIPTFPSSVS